MGFLSKVGGDLLAASMASSLMQTAHKDITKGFFTGCNEYRPTQAIIALECDESPTELSLFLKATL